MGLNVNDAIGSGPAYYPHGHESGGLINNLEITHMNVNNDRRIGGPLSYHSNFHQSDNNSLINELERATNIDLNRDGRIGGPSYLPNYGSYGGPSNPQSYGPYGGPSYPPSYGSYVGPFYPPSYGPYSGHSYLPSYGPYGGPPPNFNQSGANGLINELEKITNIDLNGDGLIGGQSNFSPYNNSYCYRD